MKKLFIQTVTLLVLLTAGLIPLSQAAYITPDSVTGTGSYYNSPDLIINSSIPAEWTVWTNSTNVWWYGLVPSLTIDLGSLYTVEDVVLQVDNNDYYKVDYSDNNITWDNLFTITSGMGEVGWGMDTMSTTATDPEYVSGIDFSPVTAQYLRIYAIGGDYMYSVSELDAYGTTQVPEPGTIILAGTGLAALLAFRKAKKKY